MKSISHATKVLLHIADASKPLGVTEVAKQLGVHKSSASRILATLHKVHFVERDPETGRYLLGLGILSLAGTVLARYQLSSNARREIEILAATTGATITVSGWNGREAVNLDQIVGPRAVTTVSPPGRLNPPHCTATGKVFLAHADQQTIQAVLAQPLRKYTERTITDRKVLRKALDTVRRQGFALNDREFINDVTALAAPIFSAQGSIAYVIAITIPSFRFQRDRQNELKRALLSTAHNLSVLQGNGPKPSRLRSV
jgi:DNA-binding IclR family transcriptional regulator